MFDNRERFCPPKSVKEVAEAHKVCLAGIKPVQTHRVGFDQGKACSMPVDDRRVDLTTEKHVGGQ